MHVLAVGSGCAGDSDENAQAWAIHGQFTYVEQETSGFNAPYAGRNSLAPDRGVETTDATLYLGARLWPGAEGWLNMAKSIKASASTILWVPQAFRRGELHKISKNEPRRACRGCSYGRSSIWVKASSTSTRRPTNWRLQAAPTGW